MIAVAWGEPPYTTSLRPRSFATNAIPPALEPLRARFMMIVQDVSERHEIAPDVIMGPRRKANIVRARHEVFWKALHETGASAYQIARVSGAFDHSVVYRAAFSHSRRMEQLLRDSKPLPLSPLSLDCSCPDESSSSLVKVR